ncbi:MAG: HAMP domain-containing histidine kinase, partial [Anaerolineae bacterium]|nr:HAMP domain-containing histidine kinase [Anaerolineae bacterium]
MFSSLRSRLWVTYAVVIAVVLGVVGLALFIYLARNPPALRAARFELGLTAQQLQVRRFNLDQRDRTFPFLHEFSDNNGVRVVIYSAAGELLLDTAEDQAAFPIQRIAPARFEPHPVAEFTDEAGERWLYTGFRGQSGESVIVAMPRPRLLLISVLADELFAPLARAAGLALLLSLLFAILISRWVAAPLQKMAAATKAVAAGQVDPIKPEGPREVKSLARALNAMNAQVHSSRQSQRDFVANVSHELKTPLTSIQGFAQAILDGAAKTPQELEKAGQVIFDEAGRMHRMVVDLLDLAKLEGGTAELLKGRVELPDLLRGTVEKFAPQSKQAKVELQTDIGPLPGFSGDGDRLAQVFGNLLDNAIKHTPAGGRVVLHAHQSGDHIEISVEDTGSGIPPEELKRIFERFYQWIRP